MSEKNNENFSEQVLRVIKEKIESAKKIELIQKETKTSSAIFAFRGNYDPWLLSPRQVSLELGITLNNLEQIIIESKNIELKERWADLKEFQAEVMLYDNNLKALGPLIAEYVLKIFDKNATTKTDVIVQETNFEKLEYEIKIKNLELQIKNLKNEK